MFERLRSALGDEAVRTPADTGARFRAPAPATVVAPADVEQAVAAIRICAENGWTVQPAGAGTWLHAGSARSADVLLSAERLSGVIEYEPADLALAVHAGTPLSDLDDAARSHAQFFPVEPAAAAGATVGGTIATASAGPLRLGHGTPRDHVLGLQIVTGDGRRLDLGGRVVKNVAGYDMVRLMVGSYGSLGFITRAFLRLRSRPARDITAVFRADDPESLHQAAAAITDTWPVAAELLAPNTAGRLLPGSGWVLAVRWHGNSSYAKYVTQRINTTAPVPEVLEAADAERVWTGLARLEADQTAAFQMATRPDLLLNAIRAAQSLTELVITQSDNRLDVDGGDPWHLAAHARSGIVRIWSSEPGAPDREPLRRCLAAVRQHVTGSATVRTLVFPADDRIAASAGFAASVGDPLSRTEMAGTGEDKERVGTLMRGIRHAFDPGRTFAPDPTVEPA